MGQPRSSLPVRMSQIITGDRSPKRRDRHTSSERQIALTPAIGRNQGDDRPQSRSRADTQTTSHLRSVVGPVGFEPTTYGLKVRSSNH